jgi:asparagine synthase (glutamine-hydrolysing)
MCGICGQVNPEGVNPDDLRRMLQIIAHRGPDDQGEYLNGPVGLGSRRLSIIDPVGGRQPLSNEDQTIWIVCNGEIYNYRQLRAELQGRGHSFRTNTDTEVIVHLYEELGERCVERLRGMFAFAIWDGIGRKLVLARDRLGQKPLFYSQDGDRFLFGSEAKAILAVSRQPRDLDHESLHHYFSLRFIPPPATMFRHVRKLPPAHLLILERGSVRVSRYWSLSFRDKLNLSQEQAEERLREELSDAVGTHLVSDVPVGALLSGGMDSSVVVALAAQQLSEPLATFSIGVKAQDFNELPFARIVADRCQTRHTEQSVDVDLVRMLPKIIWHMDEPSDPIAACQFSSAALAARQVKVVLGGDGGDELFAGFDRYAGLRHVDRYARVPELLRRGVGPLLRGVPDTFRYKSLGQKLRWVDRLASLSGTAARYAEATSFFRFSHLEKQDVFTPDLWRLVGNLQSADVIIDQFERADSDDPIDRMLYADYMTRLPEHSLMLTDRMTMAHGLELRSPLLDHRLVEFMAAIPSRMKIRRGELKVLLRRVAEAYLPPTITRRPKQGFMFPVAYWFQHELNPFLNRFWCQARVVEAGLIRGRAVRRLIEEHRTGQFDHHVRLWMLLNFELWYRIYIEQESLAVVAATLDECLALPVSAAEGSPAYAP